MCLKINCASLILATFGERCSTERPVVCVTSVKKSAYPGSSNFIASFLYKRTELKKFLPIAPV